MKQKIQWNSIKNKLLAVLLALCTTILALPAGFSSQAAVFPEFRSPINYGRGAFSAEVQGTAICYDSEGNPEICYGLQGGWLYIVNPVNGQLKRKERIQGATQLHSLVTGSDGNVYFNPYNANNLKRYNPKTGEITDLKGFNRNGTNICCQSAYDGKIYFGVYHADGGRVLEYDILNDTTYDYGVIKNGAQYVEGVAADEKYIYAGVGPSSADQPDIHAVIRIDKTTERKKQIVGPVKNISVFREITVAGDNILVFFNGGTGVFDKVTYNQSQLIKWFRPSSPHSEVHPEYPNKVYGIYSDNKLYEYDLDTYTLTPLTEILPTAGKVSGLGWVKIDGRWALEFHTQFFNYIGYYYPDTNETVINLPPDITNEDVGPHINGFEMSPDDVLYIGGYQTSMSAYDTVEEKFIYKIPNWPQNEGTGFMNGKVYFGTYSDAVMYRYDPKEPIKYVPYKYDENYQGAGNNPTMVWDIQNNQDRPYLVENYGDKLYIGTTCGYGKLGGALNIYEEDEEGNPSKKEIHRHIIPDQSITGIAVKGDLVYLSGTIRGGLGITPTETQAKMAVLDTKKGELTVEPFVPNLPVVGTTSTTIGDLSFGPDGLLWGVSEKEGLVFAMDSETFEVKKYAVTNAGDDRGALTRPLYLRWGPDGLLYTNAGWHISVIDPETAQYKKILAQSVSLMTLDSLGNIWYTRGGSEFCKLPRVMDEDVIQSRVDLAKQQVVVSGTLLESSTTTLKIEAPDGTIVMFDEFEAKASQKFTKKYVVDPLQNGTYTVYLDNKNMKTPYVCELEVETPNDVLRAESTLTVEDNVQGTVGVSNFYSTSKTVQVLLAGYQHKNGKENMVCAERIVKTIPAGAYEVIELSMDKNSQADTYRIFVWDDNLNPIITEKTVR